MKIKICGMRDAQNIAEASELSPDIMGFIFYPNSPRYAGLVLEPDTTTRIPASIKKAGVFVNADFDAIAEMIVKYSLDIVQLHGSESPDLCHRLKENGVGVIKAFSIRDVKTFLQCTEYTDVTDYFLFDTLTPDYGGSGLRFEWKILQYYNLDHPFFLSGGIGPADVGDIMKISHPALYGIDINSKFESVPGLKDINTSKKFISEIRLINY
jgi:phosphoribosylanthranilate isomerase